MEHFMNPRNVGEIENADGKAMVGAANFERLPSASRPIWLLSQSLWETFVAS